MSNQNWGQLQPHEEEVVTCRNGHQYCIVCNPSSCPMCGEIHLYRKPSYFSTEEKDEKILT